MCIDVSECSPSSNEAFIPTKDYSLEHKNAFFTSTMVKNLNNYQIVSIVAPRCILIYDSFEFALTYKKIFKWEMSKQRWKSSTAIVEKVSQI